MAFDALHYAMYVRWQTYRSQALRPRHRAYNDERARLKAILVESVRVDGEPRQKYIAFLGSLTIDKVGDPHPRFWYDVTTRLEGLGDRISPKDFERITTSIAMAIDHQARHCGIGVFLSLGAG